MEYYSFQSENRLGIKGTRIPPIRSNSHSGIVSKELALRRHRKKTSCSISHDILLFIVEYLATDCLILLGFVLLNLHAIVWQSVLEKTNKFFTSRSSVSFGTLEAGNVLFCFAGFFVFRSISSRRPKLLFQWIIQIGGTN